MCHQSIAFCDFCGFNRNIFYQRCYAWVWSYRQIQWDFETPLDSIPKPSNCPFLDGEVICQILPGRCVNKQCPGHAVKDELDNKKRAKGTMDNRTDAEKIDAKRVNLGFKQIRPQGFGEQLDVGRPHQRRRPVVILGFKSEEGSGWGRVVRPSEEQRAEVDDHTSGGIPIPLPPTGQKPVRRRREFNGPMMIPH
ncbi:hypothetical protein CPLU01_02360 [Colletotrichum plurivorum]|uniref:Uncharacterized protein n=1 Tax=Colletotrichum plurivorum TaxID=2175906 RepID=A0A8H6KVS7_9PEZI|nr:hypothetical protein CPLU01_02360 [Colletotrichum plurivorum]